MMHDQLRNCQVQERLWGPVIDQVGVEVQVQVWQEVDEQVGWEVMVEVYGPVAEQMEEDFINECD